MMDSYSRVRIQRLVFSATVALTLCLSSYARVASAAPSVTYLCAPTAACDKADLVGVDVDQTTNVIYAVDGAQAGGDGVGERLIRIDGENDSYVDSFPLANCDDPRRPAVAHTVVSHVTITKIYVGCETTHEVVVLKVTGGRLGTISEVTRIPLNATSTVNHVPMTFSYEPKTERANDAIGHVYVVGDAPNSFPPLPHAACNDPAFDINVTTDTVQHVNSTMGTLTGPAAPCNEQNGYTGINDVAVNPLNNQVFWFNEDDHRVYRTDSDLSGMRTSRVLPTGCPNEDYPEHGAVMPFGGQQTGIVLAAAHEASQPCLQEQEQQQGGGAPGDTSPENGALYSLYAHSLNPPMLRFQAVPKVGAGAVAPMAPRLSRGMAFLVTNGSIASGVPNCMVSCVQVRNIVGSLIQLIPLDLSQHDVVYNKITGKAYLALEQNGNHNIAVVNFNP